MLRRYAIRCLAMSAGLIAAVPAGAAAPPVKHVVHVLFIGNSLTYFNQMPRTFKAMVEATSPDTTVDVMSVAPNGLMLRDHWGMAWTQAHLRERRWDYVVLQEQGGLQRWTYKGTAHPAPPEAYTTYAGKFAGVAKASGSTVVLYETRGKKDDASHYYPWVFTSEANTLSAILAPAGRVVDSLPDDLQAVMTPKGDGHPTPAGSCVISATLASSMFATPGAKLMTACPPGADPAIAARVAPYIDRTIAEIGHVGAYKALPPPAFDEPPRPAPGDVMDATALTGTWYGRTPGIPLTLGVRITLAAGRDGKLIAGITSYTFNTTLALPVDDIAIHDGVLTLRSHDSIRAYAFRLARHGNTLTGYGSAWVNGGDTYDDATFVRSDGTDEYFRHLDVLAARARTSYRKEGLETSLTQLHKALYAWLGKAAVEELAWGGLDEGPWGILIDAGHLAALGDNATAAAYYQLALKRYPDDLDVLSNYAMFLQDTGKYREALPLMEKTAAVYRAKIPTGFESEYDWRAGEIRKTLAR